MSDDQTDQPIASRELVALKRALLNLTMRGLNGATVEMSEFEADWLGDAIADYVEAAIKAASSEN